jgi:histidinol-phosphatase (PHP family)
MKTLLYETHSHTPLCKHAAGEPQDYAAAAFRRGFDGLVVTCHNPMPEGFSPTVRMHPDEFDDYLRLVFRARQQWRGRIDVRLGIEADFFPGHERWLEHQLQLADFQYVIGSVHPQIREFRERFATRSPLDLHRAYFRLLGDAAETGLFDCLSHPDMIKNMTPDDWDPNRVHDDVCRMLDRVATTGIAMELNTSGVHKEIPEMNPYPGMLAEMCKRSIPVVIGADAHVPSRVGEGYAEALDLLEQAGYAKVSIFINRARHDMPIAAVRDRLERRYENATSAPCWLDDVTLQPPAVVLS